MTTDSDPFVDYYEILQVNPTCDARVLESAYHHLAKIYHPDHSDTPDVDRLGEVILAYRALRDPHERDKYNLLYENATGFSFVQDEEETDEEFSAASDAKLHEICLLYLYKRRRENAQDAGVGRYYVQQILNCSDEHFEFHVWYLKSKGLIETTEQGTLAITIEGVDHVIAMSRNIEREKLQISQSVSSQDQTPS